MEETHPFTFNEGSLMLLHQFVAAHRREILEACSQAAPGEPGTEQMGRYAALFLDEMLRFLESKNVRDLGAARSIAEDTSERFEFDLASLIGESEPMRHARRALEQLGRRSRASVLLVGEFGTGKQHCARVLHAATFPEGGFFELSVESVVELEAKICSLRRVASANAIAGLTVYVPELTDLPASLQLKLSKWLSEPGLHFRLIAASNRALAQGARDGRVRAELAFRFPNQLELPPLRDRLADLTALVQHFAELAASRRGSWPTRFGQSAMDRLRDYAWPGNLAELSNVVEQVTQNYGPSLVEADDLPSLDERPSGVDFHLPVNGIDFAELERQLITQALVMAGNNQTRAAGLLGLSRDQLRYRLVKFDISANSA
jgi:two-component system response regulator AtoC